MAIKDIKQHWIVACDCCGVEKTQAGTYRPSKWVGIKVAQDALDYSGAAVADASVDLMLCAECGSRVVDAINAGFNARRTTSHAPAPVKEGE